MKKYVQLLSVVIIVMISAVTFAQTPALYRDNVLLIPEGAVIEDGVVTFYRDIELSNDGAGKFSIVNAKQGHLALIEEVEIVIHTDEKRVDVVASGYRSACVEILNPLTSYKDSEFIIVIGQSEPSSEICILIAVQFEVVTPLDISGLAEGTYAVMVNGIKTQFTL